MPGRPAGIASTVFAAFLVAACTIDPIQVAPEGRLEVLGPTADFAPPELGDAWFTRGDHEARWSRMAVVKREGRWALRVVNGPESFVLARFIRARLLVSPFLSWSWNMDPPAQGRHPVRLLVGFRGGNPEASPVVDENIFWMGEDMPPFDRILVIDWGVSALERGNLAYSNADGSPPEVGGSPVVALYTARGGAENGMTWWSETIDLHEHYHRLWPQDDPGAVIITFIGVSTLGGQTPAAAYLADLLLFR